VIIKRIRKISPHPQKGMRLNRAEFGHSYIKGSKKDFFDFYYPDARSLITKIAKFHNLKKENINIGLGGESLIKDIYIWHSRKFKKKKVGFGLPNFYMYILNAKIYGYKVSNYPINPTAGSLLNVNYIKNFLTKNKVNFFVLVNPSHPFEKNWNIQDLKKIIDFCYKRKITILIDEVYQGLGSKSAYKLIKKYKNLIVLKSFSKSLGLPGVRVGYTIASERISKEIETYRLAIELPQYSINQVSKIFDKGGIFIKKITKKIINSRKYAHQEFSRRGIKSYNFFVNSVTVDLANEKNVLKVGNYLKKIIYLLIINMQSQIKNI